MFGGTEIGIAIPNRYHKDANRFDHVPQPFSPSLSQKKEAMTRTLFSILATVLLMSLLAGCKKDDASTNSDQFTDNLKLGTGINTSNLTIAGETTTFVGTPNNMIFWRLESKDDMAGSSVTMKIEKNVSGTYTTLQSYPFQNPQSYGHIMLSSFPWSQTGSYRATGILNANSKVVATRDFTVR
jgi:hypothetical protein